MSRVNGQLVTCDRCKKQIFRKTTREGETDGGFTRWNKFEDFPEGWSFPYKLGDLCPDCTKKWNDLESDFMKMQTDFMNGEAQ